VKPKCAEKASLSTVWAATLFRPLKIDSRATRRMPVSTPRYNQGLSFSPPDRKFRKKVTTSS